MLVPLVHRRDHDRRREHGEHEHVHREHGHCGERRRLKRER